MKKSEKMEAAIKAAIKQLENAEESVIKTWSNDSFSKSHQDMKYPYIYGALASIVKNVVETLKGGLNE